MGPIVLREPLLPPASELLVVSGGPELVVSGDPEDVDEGGDVAVDSGLSRTFLGMSSN